MNEETWQKVEDFLVGERIDSDHMPVVMKIRRGLIRKTKKKVRIEKNIWSEEAIVRYKMRLGEISYEKNNNTEEMLEEMNQHIKESTEKKTMLIWEKRNAWFDQKCNDMKIEARKKLRRWRNNKGSREDYVHARRKYRKKCEERKRLEQQKEEQKIREIKTESEVWQYINKEREKRSQITDTTNTHE